MNSERKIKAVSSLTAPNIDAKQAELRAKPENSRSSFTSRKLRILIVVTLIILTVQAWTGDVVNIFFVQPTTSQSYSLSGFFSGLASLNNGLLYWHASEGILLIALSISILVLAFKWSKARSVRICAILALFFVLSAAFGGFLFVLSGFANSAGGNSAQMGGSFLGVYAFYFMALYYGKRI